MNPQQKKKMLIVLGVSIFVLIFSTLWFLHSSNEASCDPARFGNLTSGVSLGFFFSELEFHCDYDGYFADAYWNKDGTYDYYWGDYSR